MTQTTLFDATEEFVDDALQRGVRAPGTPLELRREDEVLAFTPPADLEHGCPTCPVLSGGSEVNDYG